MPARVSVVLVEETGVQCAGQLASIPVDLDAGIPFLAGPVDPDGTLLPSDPVGILFPAVPAGLLFPAGPVGPFGMLPPSDSAEILFWPFLLGCRSQQAL